MRGRIVLFAALASFVGGAGQAKADVVYTISQWDVSARATFSAVSGGIKIAVVNTEANTYDASQAISQLQFTIGDGLGRPTAFTELKGTTTTFSGPATPVDFTPPTSAQHWGFSTTGSATVNLIDVSSPGLTGPGGQPNHLIVAAGSTPNASLTNTHLPSFIGEVDFFLADPTVPSNLTLADITGVKFSFGTGPETLLAPGTGRNITPPPPPPPPPPSVPEPSTLTLGGIATLGGLLFGWRRRKQTAA